MSSAFFMRATRPFGTQSFIRDVEYFMPPPPPNLSPNSEQMDYWNASAGQTWAQFYEQLDRQLSPLGSEALRAWMRFRRWMHSGAKMRD
jgi:hypothetical protein